MNDPDVSIQLVNVEDLDKRKSGKSEAESSKMRKHKSVFIERTSRPSSPMMRAFPILSQR